MDIAEDVLTKYPQEGRDYIGAYMLAEPGPETIGRFARRARRGPRAPSPNGSPRRVSGSVSGQRSNDRGERVGRAGAEDEVGVADLLPSPLDFLRCRRRVSGEYGQ